MSVLRDACVCVRVCVCVCVCVCMCDCHSILLSVLLFVGLSFMLQYFTWMCSCREHYVAKCSLYVTLVVTSMMSCFVVELRCSALHLMFSC